MACIPKNMARAEKRRRSANNGGPIPYKAPMYCPMVLNEKGEWVWGRKQNLPLTPPSVPNHAA